MTAVASPHPPVPENARFVHVSPAHGPDVDLAYERRGSGEPVVLLHGIGHHWQGWEPVLSILAASCDVVAVDLPGFGRSPRLLEDSQYEMPRVIRLMGEAFTALGLERPHVVGNSLGGLLALELGQHGYARSVTALSPAGFWNEAERRYAFALLHGMRAGAKAIPDGVLRRMARTAAGRAALTSTIYARPGRRSPEAVVAETRSMREATGFDPTLVQGRRPDAVFDRDIPDVPVTIGWGEKDRLLLPKQGARAKRTIPGARLVPLPGCGHVPMNDDPARVARLVLETVREGAGKARREGADRGEDRAAGRDRGPDEGKGRDQGRDEGKGQGRAAGAAADGGDRAGA